MENIRNPDASRWRAAITGLNVAAAITGGVFGVIGLVRPEVMVEFDERETRGTRFFAQMYGARAIAIAAVTTAVLLGGRGADASTRIVPVLSLAAAVQVADVVIAARSRTRGSIGAAIAAGIHVASIIQLGRSAAKR